MLTPGQRLKCTSGRRLVVERFLASGGQGSAYLARSPDTGTDVVAKVFFPTMTTPETRARVVMIAKLDLSRRCPVLIAPSDVIEQNGILGYVAPFFRGECLDDYLAAPLVLPEAFTERLTLATALARAVGALHSASVSHGDLHSANVLVRRAPGLLRAGLIDFDNFSAPGSPPPTMLGAPLYLAPELRMTRGSRSPALPGLACDRFSLAVLIHEVLISAHPASGYDETPERFDLAMVKGWLHDPQRPGRVHGVPGLPPEILSSDIHRLFRRALDIDPKVRPTPDEWETVLLASMGSLRSCPSPSCAMPFIAEVGRTCCPGCGQSFPDYVLRTIAGISVRVKSGSMVVGRKDLGGSEHVSENHATLRKIGPDFWIESTGRNGTARWNGATWTPLPDHSPVLLQDGDILKFGTVRATVSLAPST